MGVAPIEKCCGCEACANICPNNAINMIPDEKGFNYPLIDEKKCVNCDLCRKVCPVLNEIDITVRPEQKYFGAQNCNAQDLARSSSGGAFIALAKEVISRGGVVFGCKYDEKLNPIYDMAQTVDQLLPFQGSKYAEAEIGTSFIQAKEELDSGKLVLFTGNPCKLEGLRCFLRKNYNNLITCEIICHGVSSRRLLKEYIQYEEGVLNRHITDLSFRDKHRGWGYLLRINTTNAKGKEQIKYLRSEESYYFHYFNYGYFFRESCYTCKYAAMIRHSDIAIGDFWGIQNFYPNIDSINGYSVIIASTEKGLSLLESCKGLGIFNVKCGEISRYNPNIIKSTCPPDDNAVEWNTYINLGADRFAKRYASIYHKEVNIGKLKRVIPFQIFILIRNIKKRLRKVTKRG